MSSAFGMADLVTSPPESLPGASLVVRSSDLKRDGLCMIGNYTLTARWTSRFDSFRSEGPFFYCFMWTDLFLLSVFSKVV